MIDLNVIMHIIIFAVLFIAGFYYYKEDQNRNKKVIRPAEPRRKQFLEQMGLEDIDYKHKQQFDVFKDPGVG